MLLATAPVAACALASCDTASPPRLIFLSLLQQCSLKPDLAACVVPRAQVAPLTLPFAPRRSTSELRPSSGDDRVSLLRNCCQHLSRAQTTPLRDSIDRLEQLSQVPTTLLPSRYPIHCLSAASSVTSTSNRERLDAQIFSRRLLLGSLFSVRVSRPYKANSLCHLYMRAVRISRSRVPRTSRRFERSAT